MIHELLDHRDFSYGLQCIAERHWIQVIKAGRMLLTPMLIELSWSRASWDLNRNKQWDTSSFVRDILLWNHGFTLVPGSSKLLYHCNTEEWTREILSWLSWSDLGISVISLLRVFIMCIYYQYLFLGTHCKLYATPTNCTTIPFLKGDIRAGEMAQQVRALALLPQEHSSIPSNHMCAHMCL